MSKNYPDLLIDQIADAVGQQPDGDYDWPKIEKLCDIAIAYRNEGLKQFAERIAEEAEDSVILVV